MKSTLAYSGFLLLLLFTAITAQASSCEVTVMRIHADVQYRADDFQKQTLPWQKMMWLQKTLGTVEPSPQDAHAYTWHCSADTYLTVSVSQGYITKADGEYSSEMGAGLFSESVAPANITVNEAARKAAMPPPPPKRLVVIHPLRTMQPEMKMKKHTTHAPIIPIPQKPPVVIVPPKLTEMTPAPIAVTPAIPTVVVTPPQPVMPTPKVEVPTPPSVLPSSVAHEKNKSVEKVEANTPEMQAKEQAVKDFQEWFHMKVPKDKVKAVALKMLADYYMKLKHCKTGEYKFPTINESFGQPGQPMLILGKAAIKGFKNGKCYVAMRPDSPTDKSMCGFSQGSLDYLEEKKIGSGNNSALTVADVKKLNDIMSSSCPKRAFI
jgi:hypothetical protein